MMIDGPGSDLPFKNPDLSPGERVKDLLSRMTLEEKAAQMICVWNEKNDTLVDENGNFDAVKARESFKDGWGSGQVGRPGDAGGGRNAREMAVLTNEIQRFFIEESRLGIPVVFHEECLHGLSENAATFCLSQLAGRHVQQPADKGSVFNGSRRGARQGCTSGAYSCS
jgi:beta-glucosidase